MKVKKIYFLIPISFIFLIIFLLVGMSFVSAVSPPLALKVSLEDLPLKNILQDELARLNSYRMVVNILDSYHGIRILPESEETKNIIKHFSHMRPNFLAEAFFILPVQPGKEHEAIIKVANALKLVKKLEEIPYYSSHNNTWNPLFEDIEVKGSDVSLDGSLEIIANQKMRPFEPYTSVYRYSFAGNSVLYENYNDTPVYYKWMKGVARKNMHIDLLVKAYPGYLFFYSVGGARAFSFFGIFGERLDMAFTGRFDAFFKWIHKEFVFLPALVNSRLAVRETSEIIMGVTP